MKIAIPLSPEETSLRLNKAYFDYISEAGYDPIAVVPHNDALTMAELCDGLLLPGGKDIDPIYYGEDNLGSFGADSDKDDFERKLLWAFINHSKPVFGICRGFQLIAREYLKHMGNEPVTAQAKKTTIEDRLVYFQDIRSHNVPQSYNMARTKPHHYVTTRIDILYGIESDEKLGYQPVNSMHHQYLHVNMPDSKLEKLENCQITPHLRIAAWTDRGLTEKEAGAGVVCEGFLLNNWVQSKIAGVQWHPEELRDYALVNNFFGMEEAEEEDPAEPVEMEAMPE